MKKIIVLNMGSTSSKLAYYEDRTAVHNITLHHSPDDLKQFRQILDQFDYRKGEVKHALEEAGVNYKEADAIVTRGGHTVPLTGGVYEINDEMIRQVKTGIYGRHASDIGVLLAKDMAGDGKAVPMTVDPPVTDEFNPLARYSGLPEISRSSQFHALNSRAAARKYAESVGKAYEELNLIVIHMGGGTSCAAHQKGKMTDANSGLYEGPFSTNRAGCLPTDKLIRLCFEHGYTKEEMLKKVNGDGGMLAYIGETDVKTVEEKGLAGNRDYKECLDAMIYQTCKEAGAMATVLCGEVDAIVITGGIAHSEYITGEIKRRLGFIADVALLPGEFEMEALSKGAYEALMKETELQSI